MAEIWKSTSSFSYGSHCEKATAALEQTEIYIFQPQQHIKRPIIAEIAATNCRSHGFSWKKVEYVSERSERCLFSRRAAGDPLGKTDSVAVGVGVDAVNAEALPISLWKFPRHIKIPMTRSSKQIIGILKFSILILSADDGLQIQLRPFHHAIISSSSSGFCIM